MEIITEFRDRPDSKLLTVLIVVSKFEIWVILALLSPIYWSR
jgi:hypothetical protein